MPAASVNIPGEALPDLKRIAELDDALFDSLVTAIGEAPPALTRSQFAKKLVAKIGESSEEDIQAVLRVAFVLYAIKDRAGVSSQELTEGIGGSVTTLAPKDFPPPTIDRLRSRLSRLLGFDTSLGVSVKALDVMTEHERTFCRARILSDIRPVFTDQLESSSAMIVHTLQIGFHSAGDHHDYYFALDTDDIQTLKNLIERAEKKTLALQSVLKKAGVRYLEV